MRQKQITAKAWVHGEADRAQRTRRRIRCWSCGLLGGLAWSGLVAIQRRAKSGFCPRRLVAKIDGSGAFLDRIATYFLSEGILAGLGFSTHYEVPIQDLLDFNNKFQREAEAALTAHESVLEKAQNYHMIGRNGAQFHPENVLEDQDCPENVQEDRIIMPAAASAKSARRPADARKSLQRPA